MGTKARVPRLDGAETEAGSRQRAKASQEQKEHPISKEAQLETQEKGPSTAFISSLLPKPCSQGTLLPPPRPPKKLATYPLATLRWGPIYSPAGRTARMSGVSPRVEKGERTVSSCPLCGSCPSTFHSHHGPCTPGCPALVGTLPYRGQPQGCVAHSQTAGEALGRTGQELTRFGL